MKKLFKFKYPKLFLLVVAIILAYVIFSNEKTAGAVSSLNSLGYLGSFVAGLFFSFGFTSPFSAGFFLVLNPENILLAGILGGFGALLADMFIFFFIKFSFMDEFYKLEKTKLMKETSSLIDKSIGHKIKIYILYAIAGIFIASPLPDELGVIMLAGLTRIKAYKLAIISFLLNTIGILVLLSI